MGGKKIFMTNNIFVHKSTNFKTLERGA